MSADEQRHALDDVLAATYARERDAAHSIDGYRWQFLQTALRLIDLDDASLVAIEGSEDLQRVGCEGGGDGGVVTIDEQFKRLADALSVRSPDGYSTLFNFAYSHFVDYARAGVRGEFRFLTTARRRKQQVDDALTVDLFAEWQGMTPEALRDAMVAVLERYGSQWDAGKSAVVRTAIAAASGDHIERFQTSVAWGFEAPGSEVLEATLLERVRGDVRRSEALNPSTVADQLLLLVFRKASDGDPRRRTVSRQDVTDLVLACEVRNLANDYRVAERLSFATSDELDRTVGLASRRHARGRVAVAAVPTGVTLESEYQSASEAGLASNPLLAVGWLLSASFVSYVRLERYGVTGGDNEDPFFVTNALWVPFGRVLRDGYCAIRLSVGGDLVDIDDVRSYASFRGLRLREEHTALGAAASAVANLLAMLLEQYLFTDNASAPEAFSLVHEKIRLVIERVEGKTTKVLHGGEVALLAP